MSYALEYELTSFVSYALVMRRNLRYYERIKAGEAKGFGMSYAGKTENTKDKKLIERLFCKNMLNKLGTFTIGMSLENKNRMKVSL